MVRTQEENLLASAWPSHAAPSGRKLTLNQKLGKGGSHGMFVPKHEHGSLRVANRTVRERYMNKCSVSICWKSPHSKPWFPAHLEGSSVVGFVRVGAQEALGM